MQRYVGRRMVSKNLIHRCFEISTLYTAFTVAIFLFKSDFNIKLTYRRPTYRWGELRTLFKENPLVLPKRELESLLSVWCPSNLSVYSTSDSRFPANSSFVIPVSPQCSCIREFNATFVNNSKAYLNRPKGDDSQDGPKDLSELGDLQAKMVTEACLMKRATWQRHTCSGLCQMHIAMPVMLSCLSMSLFLAGKVEYGTKTLKTLSFYVPITMAVLVIVVNAASNPLEALPVIVTVLSMLFEVYTSCSFSSYIEDFREYWSFHRFFVASIAVQSAISHQARDVYVVYSYAILGFSIGMLAYTEYILRFKQGSNKRMRVVAIYSWVGICVITASLFLLVHQHWYSYSPAWSSLISVICLFIACIQCVVMIPGVWVSETIQLSIGFILLTVSLLAVTADLFVVRDS